MAYQQDVASSARRHFRAANELHASVGAGAQPGCKAVAGYLYGLSGELALKAIMRDSGMRPLERSKRNEDPFFAHFPELKSQLRNTIQGRRSAELRVIVDSIGFQNWDIEMRYAPTSDIKDAWIEAWKNSAQYLVAKMDE